MALSHSVALSIFASYFLTILALFTLIVRSFPCRLPPNVSLLRPYTFIALTVASLAHTWYYMFAFLKWSFDDFERAAYTGLTTSALDALPISTRIATWLSHTALFEQAWTVVARTPLNWWWSEQLCLFTAGTWTIVLATYGRTHRVKHLWAYMLLGQLVAISTASSLFYYAILISPRPKTVPPPKPTKSKASNSAPATATTTTSTRHIPLPPTTYLPVLLSTILTLLLPTALEHDLFLPVLLAIHALLVLPLLPLPARLPLPMRTRTLYALLLPLALLARIRTHLSLASGPAGLPHALWETLHAHPAQASIGWDVVWTTLAFAVWARAWAAPVLSALVSVGVVGPAVGVGMGA